MVTYFINDCISFKFLVTAQAELVNLDVSKKILKFNFPDDNTDMSIAENIVVTNNGNATAKFTWRYNENGHFIPSPVEDRVEAGSSKIVKVTFTPPGPKPEDEILTMKIEDGNSYDLKCQGFVNDSKCAFIEKSLEFGNVPVGIKARDQIVNIKN